MQIKMTQILSHSKMANINKTINNKCWQGCRVCGGTETLIHFSGEWKLVQPLWKSVWRSIKKLETELAYDPSIPLLGMYFSSYV
jgi:hypothetical protein